MGGRRLKTLLWMLGALVLVAAGQRVHERYEMARRAARVPAAADRPVTFAQDVTPIFDDYCTRCHHPTKKLGGLDMTSPRAIAEGGDSGPAATPELGTRSLLLLLAVGEDGEWRMPPDPPPMPADDLAVVRAWIEQGMR